MESSANFFKNYDVEIDKAIFKSLLPIYLKHLSDDLESNEVNKIVQKYNSIDALVEDFYKSSKLNDEASVGKLLGGNQKSLDKQLAKDPIYQFSSLIIDNFINQIQPKLKSLKTREEDLMKKYVNSLMETFPEKAFWADANSTLRLTYGKVEGSSPRDGMKYQWFTTIDGIIEKYNTGESDFEIPQRLLDLYEDKNYGRYGNNGSLNICF